MSEQNTYTVFGPVDPVFPVVGDVVHKACTVLTTACLEDALKRLRDLLPSGFYVLIANDNLLHFIDL